MNHRKTRLTLSLVLFLCLLLLNGCAAPTVILPEFTEDVLLCSPEAKAEFDGDLSLESAVESGDPYRAFRFEYQLKGASGTLRLSDDPSLSDAREYPMPESETAVVIDNLMVDTTYYYQVTVKGQVYRGSFHTASSTRFVSIPGLTNTRDVGGITNQDGKIIRQGLLIRGVEPDGLVCASYFLPAGYIDRVNADFGFVYDLDLREASLYDGPYTSRLEIRQKFYTAPMYDEIFDPAYLDSLREIFTDLADPNNYPMYLHCTYGRDRTGTVVYLLQGILNVSEEAMLREYYLSSYTYPGLLDYDYIDLIAVGLEGYAGDTLQEKIVTFLTDEVGITREQIDSIRSIFLSP